ncbi:unnamed protein product [Symbiodinium sp. CCMP2592]|nr:unnamed protein product [Symbiodinium sp. CCMP2592]
MQTLAASEEGLPALKFVVRDRAHRMRSVQKQTWDALAGLCTLLPILVTSEGSVCRQLENSRKLGLLWEASQRAKPSQFTGALRSFSFCMQRFESASMPLYKILRTLPALYEFLARVCKDGDLEDEKWARNVLEQLTGTGAGAAIVRCGIVSDAMLTCNRFLRLCDKADDDACLAGSQAAEVMHSMKHLFYEGALLEAQESMTLQAMRTIQEVGSVRVLARRTAGARGARPEHILPVWNDSSEQAIKKDMKRVYKIVDAYFRSNFPHWDYMNSLSALDLHAKLSMTQRKSLVARMAKQWGLNADALWPFDRRNQLVGNATETDVGNGLFARALWHARNPSQQPSKDAWVCALSELRKGQVQQRPDAVKLVKHALTFMTSTCNVERWLHEIGLTEHKSRAHHLNVYRLEDAVKLNVQNMKGRCSVMQADYLTTSVSESQQRGVRWQASDFGLRAQRAYAEYFGDRELPARDLLAMQDRSDKPRLAPLRASSEKSLNSQLKRHKESLDSAVSQRCKKPKIMSEMVAAAEDFASSVSAWTSDSWM